MERCELRTLLTGYCDLEGKEVSVSGWARTVRDSKTIGFIELNDGSSFKCVQIVFEEGKVDNFKEIAKLGGGSFHPRLSPSEKEAQRGVSPFHRPSASPHKSF